MTIPARGAMAVAAVCRRVQIQPMPSAPAHRRPAPALARIAHALRRILGAPDYERYVAHVRDRHPGAEPMSRDEFLRERLASRYSKPGARCC